MENAKTAQRKNPLISLSSPSLLSPSVLRAWLRISRLLVKNGYYLLLILELILMRSLICFISICFILFSYACFVDFGIKAAFFGCFRNHVWASVDILYIFLYLVDVGNSLLSYIQFLFSLFFFLFFLCAYV